MAIILDLETVAVEGVEIEPVSAPSNYKDPEKIAAYIADGERAQRERAALYPWTARIIAAGWCHEGDEVVTVRLCNGDAGEAAMLRELWSMVQDGRTGLVEPVVTFNGRGYDLLVLMARSRLLGVPYPALNVDRYRSPHPDLMQILSFNGAIQARSLTWYARRFGLSTDDAFSGREIAQLYESQNWDAITAHVTSDVTLTRQLGERLGVLKPLKRAA